MKTVIPNELMTPEMQKRAFAAGCSWVTKGTEVRTKLSEGCVQLDSDGLWMGAANWLASSPNVITLTAEQVEKLFPPLPLSELAQRIKGILDANGNRAAFTVGDHRDELLAAFKELGYSGGDTLSGYNTISVNFNRFFEGALGGSCISCPKKFYGDEGMEVFSLFESPEDVVAKIGDEVRIRGAVTIILKICLVEPISPDGTGLANLIDGDACYSHPAQITSSEITRAMMDKMAGGDAWEVL